MELEPQESLTGFLLQIQSAIKSGVAEVCRYRILERHELCRLSYSGFYGSRKGGNHAKYAFSAKIRSGIELALSAKFKREALSVRRYNPE
jgi:hypothetical protein